MAVAMAMAISMAMGLAMAMARSMATATPMAMVADTAMAMAEVSMSFLFAAGLINEASLLNPAKHFFWQRTELKHCWELKRARASLLGRSESFIKIRLSSF